jgi:hypothetical protein
MKQIHTDFVVARLLRANAARVDDRAHTIPIDCREAAGKEFHAFDQARIEQTHRAEKVLEVKRLVQTQAVENDRYLARLPAAHRTNTRKPVRCAARQALHRTQGLIRELRQVLQLILTENRRQRREIVADPVPTRLHDDFFHWSGGCNVCLRRIRRTGSRTSNNRIHPRRSFNQRQSMLREDLAREFDTCLRLWLGDNTQLRGNRVLAVNER